MHLIADSGSTKTDWASIDVDGNVEYYHTEGLNPIFNDVDQLAIKIQQCSDLLGKLPDYMSIEFYGAGCFSKEHKNKVKLALTNVFPNAVNIQVEDDLMAAVKATANDEPGIIGILGTGSNACVYDGVKIHQATPALGFILGDEASGAYFGKILVQHFLYKSLPPNLMDDFEKTYQLDKARIIESVYRKEQPNAFLASFMPFYMKHRHVLEIKHILSKGFKAFLNNHILCYPESAELPIHFVGSIARVFYPELVEVAAYMDLQIGKIVGSPIEELVKNINGVTN